MSTRFPQERREYIEKKLLVEGKIRVSELAALFAVSSETIRKDLLYLEEKGIAKKGYGGAIVANERLEPSYLEKSIIHQEEKQRIAQGVIDLIQDGMTLMMDAGSTVFTVAKMLGMRNNLTVFTNAPRTALLLDDYQINTHILGGEFRSNSNALIGGWTVNAIKEIRADAAIIGTSGFCGRKGPCVENFPESEIKKAMISNSNKVIVIGDSSKAQTSALIQYSLWEDIDTFVTDEKLPKELQKELGKSTKLLIV